MYFPPRPLCSPVLTRAHRVRCHGKVDHRAFTLLELLAVIAIFAVLASMVIGVGRRAAEHTKVARAQAELAVLSAALESFKRHHGDFPATDDASRLLQALIGKAGPAGIIATVPGRAFIVSGQFTIARAVALETPCDPFSDASAVLLDPWLRPYRYAYKTPAPWTNPSFVLYSAGPDGEDSPALLGGGFPDGAPAANVDNLYALRN
ncbi:MAG: hypothetical protein C0518_03620 [Opitutus sp.]|nr:hypothetical protein [Opitutus sp.]